MGRWEIISRSSPELQAPEIFVYSENCNEGGVVVSYFNDSETHKENSWVCLTPFVCLWQTKLLCSQTVCLWLWQKKTVWKNKPQRVMSQVRGAAVKWRLEIAFFFFLSWQNYLFIHNDMQLLRSPQPRSPSVTNSETLSANVSAGSHFFFFF